MPAIEIRGSKIFCPLCKEYVSLLSVAEAARIASMNERTIRRYIENRNVFSVKVAGRTHRVCSGCLLRQDTQDSE